MHGGGKIAVLLMCDSPPPPTSQKSSNKKPVTGLCIKCKTSKPQVAIRRQILYCKKCFVRAFVVKFRSAIAKSRKRSPTPRTRVMVAFSGGPSSSAMVKLMADYQNTEKNTKSIESFYTDVVVGHVDESILFSGYEDDAICDIAKQNGLDTAVSRLEDVFDMDNKMLIELVHAKLEPGASRNQLCARIVADEGSKLSKKEQLLALFASLGSLTNKEEMLSTLKTYLLVQLARKTQCGVLLVGESSTRLATKIIALTSRGRGYSLPFEVGAETSWFKDVVIYRPMRDCIMKEVGFFNRWTEQPSVVVPTFSTGLLNRSSIDRLTESFVVGLDRDFPSTVPTVCRTMEKLAPQAGVLEAPVCILCQMPAEIDAHVWRSRLTVSSTANSSEPESSGDSSLLDVTPHLCYSCQTTLHGAKSDLVLPGYCSDLSLHSHDNGPDQRREALRRQIKEFFIQ